MENLLYKPSYSGYVYSPPPPPKPNEPIELKEATEGTSKYLKYKSKIGAGIGAVGGEALGVLG